MQTPELVNTHLTKFTYVIALYIVNTWFCRDMNIEGTLELHQVKVEEIKLTVGTFGCCVCWQWKVRRTLAFSIHHLANILGEELTRTELVPVFDELLKDLDEVRIGLLKHLVDFLQVT